MGALLISIAAAQEPASPADQHALAADQHASDATNGGNEAAAVNARNRRVEVKLFSAHEATAGLSATADRAAKHQ